MKQLLLLTVLACGGVWAVSAWTSRGTAGAADTPGLPSPGVALIPDVLPGDPVRVVLQRDKSGENGWLGGVVNSVDADHISIRGTLIDHVPLDGGGTVSVARKVDHWVPMTSVLYLEKFVDGKGAEQLP